MGVVSPRARVRPRGDDAFAGEFGEVDGECALGREITEGEGTDIGERKCKWVQNDGTGMEAEEQFSEEKTGFESSLLIPLLPIPCSTLQLWATIVGGKGMKAEE